MNRQFFPTRLGRSIVLYMICAFAVAAAIYFALQFLSDELIDRSFTKSSVKEELTREKVESFQTYVSENSLSTLDISEIQFWVNGEKYVLMNIYKNNFLIYSSSASGFIQSNKYKKQEISPPWRQLYDVVFADGSAEVDMIWLAAFRYYDIMAVIDLSISFVCFLTIFLFLIKKKVSYINQLANELKILEGGDLNRPVTVKGKDELSSLAQGIDEMRRSFLERMESEKTAHMANSDLITSISHDLRTPLTILIGFLDVIACKKYETEDQLSRYIISSRQKAYQIKDLSDKLFEYFLVYGSANRQLKLERQDGSKLLTQLLWEHTLSLEDQGFHVQTASHVPRCTLEVNLIAIRRVFDNLFSNIAKYADAGYPVAISFEKADDWLFVTVSNKKSAENNTPGSTEIGLKTCEKIMAQHNGSIMVRKSDELFTVTVCFPFLERPQQEA